MFIKDKVSYFYAQNPRWSIRCCRYDDGTWWGEVVLDDNDVIDGYPEETFHGKTEEEAFALAGEYIENFFLEAHGPYGEQHND